MKKGLFITVEGTDGSGKTTQINLIKDYIEAMGYEVILTREPGGTYISEKIRSIVLDTGNAGMGSITEMLLYASARAQLVWELIKPAIESGKTVICDRFVDSSYVYQGFGRGINLETITAVNSVATAGTKPDITFFFNLSPEIALRRRISSTGADRIEREKMEFHIKVYEGYKKLAYLYPDRVKTIDASRSIEDIFADVRRWIDLLYGKGNTI
jgi:dTMP kinase